jgi:electron transfer flavoprotein alpha subunit
LGWRPHGDVGQTGKPVATNLYIAIGIQELSTYCRNKLFKIKVVINNDPEARFLKSLTME